MNLSNLNNEKLYIDGNFVDSKSGKWIDIENPATEEIIARVPRANKEDIEDAINAAYEAFPSWSKVSLEERVEYIKKFNDRLIKNQDELNEAILLELGIPKHVGYGSQVKLQIDRIDTFIKEAKNIKYEIPMDGGFVRMEPIGVVASITPWNYPLGQIVMKVIPALLMGCTVVEKPASDTPLTAYLVAKGFDEIGLPKGVFNLITGKGSEVGDVLNASDKVAMISYTGSLKGGAQSGKLAMDTAKKVVLELGGKSPAIFLPGADIKKSVKQVLNSIYNNVGQTCSALSRAIVLEDIYDEVLDEFLDQYENYPNGDPTKEETIVGPLASMNQFEKVGSYIKKGIEEGATLIRGEVPEKPEKGYYIKPAIFTDVKPGMEIHDNEIFGPVLSIIKVKDKDEALEIANAVNYGLSGAVFGNKEEALELAKEIRTGEVYVNGGGSTELPFGGYKQSGIGREGGIFGLYEYLEPKAINMG